MDTTQVIELHIKIMISIIIPVYNTEKYLRRCLYSIIAQTYKDWECILVDDGSEDNSPSICDEYVQKDNRFKVIHKENAGVSAARNDGLDQAKGEWISFVDSDDYLASEFLDKLYQYRDYDYLVGSYQIFPRRVKMIVGNEVYTSKEFKKFLRPANLYNGYPWGKLFKRSIIEQYHVRFILGLKVYEDYLFNLDYMEHISSVAITPKANYFYYDPVDKIIPVKFPMEKEEILFLYDKVKSHMKSLSDKWHVKLPAITFNFIQHYHYDKILDSGNDNALFDLYKQIYLKNNKEEFYLNKNISPVIFLFGYLFKETTWPKYCKIVRHAKKFYSLYGTYIADNMMRMQYRLVLSLMRHHLFILIPAVINWLHAYDRIKVSHEKKTCKVMYMSDIVEGIDLGR